MCIKGKLDVVRSDLNDCLENCKKDKYRHAIKDIKHAVAVLEEVKEDLLPGVVIKEGLDPWK